MIGVYKKNQTKVLTEVKQKQQEDVNHGVRLGNISELSYNELKFKIPNWLNQMILKSILIICPLYISIKTLFWLEMGHTTAEGFVRIIVCMFWWVSTISLFF